MIVVRSPLRVTLGGGGSDLQPGGYCVTAAINAHVYVAINATFDPDTYTLRYSQVEHAKRPEDIVHPLLRRIVDRTRLAAGVEISSMADIPAGTGLGSSGAYTVSVLHAIARHRGESVGPAGLAALAAELDTGWQDQYSAAFGGVRWYEDGGDSGGGHGSIRTGLIPFDIEHLERHCLLFYTGVTRDAAEALGRSAPVPRERLVEMGKLQTRALSLGDFDTFAAGLTAQYEAKRVYQPQWINDIIDTGLRAGAQGGKLVGAGQGGFVLFYASNPGRVRRAMADWREWPFSIDEEGTTCIQ